MSTDSPAARPSFSRLDVYGELPGAYRALRALEQSVRGSGLPPRLLELVRTRVSQQNGCAFCLDMHQRAARAAGEQQQRLDVLAAWREAPFFDEQERAALGLAEALTGLTANGHLEPAWAEASRAFASRELAGLVFAVTAINAWNRLAIASGMSPVAAPQAGESPHRGAAPAPIESRAASGEATR